MFSSRAETPRPEAVPPLSRLGEWQQVSLHSAAEMYLLLETIGAALTSLDYPERDVFGVRLALEEAIVNGLKHGNRADPSKRVEVRYRLTADHLQTEIEDQGVGFDPKQVPDPLAPENLDRPCGRGLLLIRSYMTHVHYNDRGNCVSLYKRRSST